MFTMDMKVGFQHCDPAGIVFYPRYYEMVNTVVEEWFSQDVGWDFTQIHMVDRFAVPTIRIVTDFTSPSHLGDVLTWELELTKIGRTSLDISLLAQCGTQTRLKSRSVLVLISMDTGKSEPWPKGIRTQFEDLRVKEKE
jgi:4-hydroxybenzoyl-CoA thioesterase